MKNVVISGSGLYTPPETISNEELVTVFNAYVQKFNHENADKISRGEVEALKESDVDFIVKASGIKSRHVITRDGILDVNIMHPLIPARADKELSLQAEVAVVAAKQAMASANKRPEDIDAVIMTCSNFQRPYPSMAIELQNALGINGFGYDMSVACSSVTFGIQAAASAVASGQAKCVLLSNPEVGSPQINYKDRESHFIFGDAATALIIERADTCTAKDAFEIVDIKLKTQFSNAIRINLGYMNRVETGEYSKREKVFRQQGRKVFKDVVPMAVELIESHLAEHHIKSDQLKRLWLHQANSNMNRLIATKILGYEPDLKQSPVILDEYANTGSAGVSIVFHKYHSDLQKGDLGIMCSFGAGYSLGNIILRKC